MKNNFDLKKFLIENKLTTNSRLLKEDFPPSPNSNIPDANAEEYDIATAFKKARVDMSKPVMVLHSYGSAAFGGHDEKEMSAEAAIKMLEAERQDRSKQYTDDGMEVPEDHHGYEFENSSVLEEDMPEGHEYKLGYFQLGDADFAITQEKSGVSEKKVNEEDFQMVDGDFPVHDAFKKAGIDMSKDVHIRLNELQGGGIEDEGTKPASKAADDYEYLRKLQIKDWKEATGGKGEFPIVYEFYGSRGDGRTAEGKPLKFTFGIFEGKSWDIFQ